MGPRARFVVLAVLIWLVSAAAACRGDEPVRLHLRAGVFDPVAEPPPIPSSRSADSGTASGLATAPTDARYHIVQCAGPILASWPEIIEQSGARLIAYLPDFAYIVRAPVSALDALRQLDFVRWVGPMLPAYKIEPELLGKRGEVDVTVVTFPDEHASAAISALVQAPERVTRTSEGGHILDAMLTPQQIEELAKDESVAWIERRLEPRLLNNAARAIMTLPQVWQDVGLYGAGQIVAVCDTGLDTGSISTLHADFQGRIAATFAYGRTGDWSDPHGHGTHVAGSVLGSGARSGAIPSTHNYGSSFAGSAPEARLVFQSVLDASGGLGGLSAGLGPILLAARNAGARVHTNSWGEVLSAGRYSVKSREVDDFCWNHKDMLVLFAAGNDGADADRNGVVDLGSIMAPSTAKDCLSVAASENLRSTGGYQFGWGEGWPDDFPQDPVRSDRISNAAAGMAAFSSRGPTLDNRFKPDIAAPGTNIISCRSRDPDAGTGWGVYNADYVYMGGTSMACPLAAGTAAVVREYYVKNRSLANPSAALIKATIVNGAADMNPGQYGTGGAREMSARPNYVEGWGRVDVAGSLCLTAPRSLAFQDSAVITATGATASYNYAVADSSVPLRVTLAWTDYPGTENALKTLVNDLDLRVVAPNGTTYTGNGTIDRVNNIEGVDIASPLSGTYTVQVSGYNIAVGPQPFALVVSGGLTGSAAQTTLQGYVRNSTGAGIADVQVSAGSYRATTDTTGKYAIRLPAGQYTVTPYKAGWTFSPASRSVTVTAVGLSDINFTGSASAGAISGTVRLRKPVSVESAHPYSNNFTYTWTISGPAGAAYTAAHFDYIDVEQDFDRLEILDSGGRVVQTYTGYYEDLTSPAVPGATIKVRLVTDYSVTYDGFAIDRVVSTKSGISVTCQPGSRTTTTDAQGAYSFGSLTPGGYTVAPTLGGWSFVAEMSQPVQVQPGFTLAAVDFAGYELSSISGRVTTATVTTTAAVTESPHPYTDNYTRTWTLTGPAGTAHMRVHFTYIDTEKDYDFVEILDSAGDVRASYSDSYSDLWSPWVIGSSIKIRLRSDYSYSDYAGFYSDSYQSESAAVGKGGVTVAADSRSATTASDGTYTLTGVSFGSLDVVPSLAGWGFDPVRRSIDLAPGVSASGVDFRALAPGAISGRAATAAVKSANQTVQSAHPYPNNALETWTITAPAGAAAVRVHFQYVDLEAEYDYVRVTSASGAAVNTYTGYHSDTWSEWVGGSQLKIVLTSDGSITRAGFVADKYEYVVPGTGIGGAVVTVSPGGRTATTASDGSYSIASLMEGVYTVAASKTGSVFVPSSQAASVAAGATTRGVDFFVNNPVPANLGVTPSSGAVPSGRKRVFSAVYTDVEGYADLASCHLLINTSATKAFSAWLWYDANAGKLYLRNDENTAWLGGLAPGAAQIIENSQCRLYCAETAVAGSGQNLTINWKIEFKATLASKRCAVSMLVKDDAARQDGWDQMGTITVTGPPVNVSLAASSSAVAPSTQVTFITAYSDPEGHDNLSECRLLVNTDLYGGKCMHLMYNPDQRRLYVRNDSNTAWLGGFAPGAGSIIENSYCRLHCSRTTVSASGGTLTVNWRVEFKPTMRGKSCKAWMLVTDDQWLQDGWEQKGTVGVGGG